MDIQPLGKHNMLIQVSSEELEGFLAPTGDLKTEDAADILKAALGDGCEEVWDNVYLELFEGRDSLLLFARTHSGDPYFFSFDDIELVITVARLCPPDVISFLMFSGGTYYLIVYPWEKEAPPGVLYEYLDAVTTHPHYALYLTEHGKTLLGPAALDELKKYF